MTTDISYKQAFECLLATFGNHQLYSSGYFNDKQFLTTTLYIMEIVITKIVILFDGI